MKKIKSIFQFYLILMVSAIVFQSCCSENFRIIGNGELRIFDATALSGVEADTIRGSFFMEVEFEREMVFNWKELSLMSTAYATSCEPNFENALVETTMTLSCSKSFVYDGQTIAANTDFSNIDELVVSVFADFGSISVLFDESFLGNVEFQNGEHVFTIAIETTDGLALESANAVVIEI